VASGLDGYPRLTARTPRAAGVGLRPALRPALVAAAVLFGSAGLAGCASLEHSGTPSAQIDSWITGGGGGAIGTLEVDGRNVDLALSQHNAPAAIRTVCALLTNDAQTAIGNLPTPDDQLTNDLNNAYVDASAAGDDCYKGASGNAALLRRSASERRKMAPLLAVAVGRIEAITGHMPSTSTTNPTDAGGDPFAG